MQFTDDGELEAWLQHLPWWAEVMYRRVTGMTTLQVPILMDEVRNVRWRSSGHGIIDPYRVGLTKGADVWVAPTTPCRNMRRFYHLLLKSFLVRRHLEKVREDAIAAS